MCHSSAPPAPDYTPLAQESEAAAQKQFQLGEDQLAWAKEQYASDKAITQQVVDAALKSQQTSEANAATDRARYEKIYQPLEDQYVAEAKSYASPERQQLEMGKAQAGVAQQFDAARKSATANLEGYGIDPSSTRYAALDLGSRVQQAAAAAGAGNTARAATEAQGLNLEGQAINIGRGYPSQVVSETGTGLQAGNSAANAALATTASGASTMGTAPQYMGMGSSSLGNAANILNTGYQNALAGYQASQQSSSGLGSALGIGMGLLGFAEGGGVPDDVTAGGNVPKAVSPSGGKAIDDVDAKLTAGEFVVPRDAVSWYGEKHFQQLIQKARKERQGAPAQPTAAISTGAPPAFVSRPQAALPMG